MVISFPVLVSETTDKEILPYLLKAIERKYALDYVDVLQNIVKKEMDKANEHLESKNEIEGVIISDNKEALLEGEFGIQIVQSDSNKLNSDQPFFITLRVTTTGRVTQDFVFGFKALSMVTKDAMKLFKHELEVSSYTINRLARKYFGEKFIWSLVKWYNKIFDKEYTKTKEFEARKVLFSEERERIVILSSNDLSIEEFKDNDPDETPLSSDNLSDSRWSSVYIDDSLNKRIYMWDESMPKFANVITYDMLYKNTLGILPEQVDKAKQRNTSLFSKRAPLNWSITKLYEGLFK
jgi:hypothetical protein